MRLGLSLFLFGSLLSSIATAQGISNGATSSTQLSDSAAIVRLVNAVGDGVTDDTSAISAGLSQAAHKTLLLQPGATYRITNSITISKPVSIDGNGATILWDKDSGSVTGIPLYYYPFPNLQSKTFSGAIAAGSATITLNNVTGLSEGQTVFVRAGSAISDPYAWQVGFYNTIRSISGNDVTLEVPFPEDIDDAPPVTYNGMPDATGTHLLSYWPDEADIPQNFFIRNLKFKIASGRKPEALLSMNFPRNVLVENVDFISGRKFSFAYGENVSIKNVTFGLNKYEGTGGENLIGMIGSRNVSIENVTGSYEHTGITLEAECRNVNISNIMLQRTEGGSTGGTGIQVTGGSKNITIKNLYWLGSDTASAKNPLSVDATSSAVASDVYLLGSVGQYDLRWHEGPLEYLGVSYKSPRWFVKTVRLRSSMSNYSVGVPQGSIWKRLKLYISNKTGITNFTLSGGAFAPNVVSDLPSNGTLEEIAGTYLPYTYSVGDGYGLNNATPKAITISTDTSVVSGSYVTIMLEHLPPESATDEQSGIIQDAGSYVRSEDGYFSRSLGVGATPTGIFDISGTSPTINVLAPSGNLPFLRLGDSATSGTRKEFTVYMDSANSKVSINSVQQGVAKWPIEFTTLLKTTQAGGNIPACTKYTLTKTANGAGGCSNANGCWSVNGGTAVNATAGLTQDVTLFTPAAGYYVHDWSIETATACSGATTITTGLGTASDNDFYTAPDYNLKAAVAVSNFRDRGTALSGRKTKSSEAVVGSLVTTVENVDQIAAGCAVNYFVCWSVLQ